MDHDKRTEPGSNDGPGEVQTFDVSGSELSREERYVLRLYIAGSTPRSRSAVRSVRKICDEHITGRIDLEVYDLHQQPWLARDAEILAAPTLVKELPPPLRRIIGSLSDIEQVLVKLGLSPRS
jgi:circadian clock protein KaiB